MNLVQRIKNACMHTTKSYRNAVEDVHHLHLHLRSLRSKPQPVYLPRDLRGGCNAGDGRRDDEDLSKQQGQARGHQPNPCRIPRLHRGQGAEREIHRNHCRCGRSSEMSAGRADSYGNIQLNSATAFHDEFTPVRAVTGQWRMAKRANAFRFYLS